MPALMLLRKLEQVMTLTDAERQTIADLPERVLQVPAREDIVPGGSRPTEVRLIRAGIACRNNVVQDGRRQITSFLVRGDCCDLRALLMGHMDHTVTALAPCDVAVVPHERLFAAIEKCPRLALALWSDTLLDAAIHREWVTNVGRRSAYARIAHLFCEIWFRLQSVGLPHDHTFHLPATQGDLGDATGLSLVHVNRTLRQLREDGLISVSKGRIVRLLDWQRLTEVAEFDPAYLQAANFRTGPAASTELPRKLQVFAWGKDAIALP
jgi:CRP-like cAMP-binding protein